MSIADKIAEIEAEIARTQKNKATEFHIGRLKARLAQLRRDLIGTVSKKGGSGGIGFDVSKTGHARVGLVGFPSVGKSTLLTKLTSAKSEIAEYEFTTLTAIPGTFIHNNTKIQLVDLPGIIEGAADGRGKGRQVIATARTSDLLLIVLDATKSITMKRKIERELEGFGIRLNKKPPLIQIEKKERGGITFSISTPGDAGLKNVSEALITSILTEYKIHNADVSIQDENVTIDDLIDVIEGNRVYMPTLYVVNKIDSITIEELELFDDMPNWIPISSEHEWNLDDLLDRIWEKLGIIRIYTKPRSGKVDFEEPVIIRIRKEEPTVETFCRHIHKEMAERLKYAVVYGTSAKHIGQQVGRNHILHDEDVVTLVTS
ncbi:Developmentally regulated GTP-binding protein 1 [Giardia muris]|uniref:Developmentally regulated GTP-binding protein 1 n=1 Tax=Giardia muris TaxID=5742 RepID=A0A4Z1TCD5_GIAMU|nr:Developmentally regulated GTP-binding protein 1 [Giardia muris]|eukprot:TNJ30239.1 Developmentally regulated GTP-binding protein 1 [Giardia muris]